MKVGLRGWRAIRFRSKVDQECRIMYFRKRTERGWQEWDTSAWSSRLPVLLENMSILLKALPRVIGIVVPWWNRYLWTSHGSTDGRSWGRTCGWYQPDERRRGCSRKNPLLALYSISNQLPSKQVSWHSISRCMGCKERTIDGCPCRSFVGGCRRRIRGSSWRWVGDSV